MMENFNKTINRITWIDCTKGTAMLGVIINHVYNKIYSNYFFCFASFYSVSLFILISGYLTFKSEEKHNFSYLESIIYHIKSILFTYLIAVFVYQVAGSRFFSFKNYIKNVFTFNISGPFYYVLLYIQLMLIGHFFYKIIMYKSHKTISIAYDIFILFLTFVFGVISVNFTKVYNDIFLYGGGYIMGSSYLFLFTLGMVISKYDIPSGISSMPLEKKIIIAMLSLFIYLIVIFTNQVFKFDIETFGLFAKGINPPGITLLLMGISMFFFVFIIANIFDSNLIIIRILSFIGKHSLYIFLYHELVLLVLSKAEKYVTFEYHIVKRIIYMSFLIIVPIVIEKFCKKTKELLCKILSN